MLGGGESMVTSVGATMFGFLIRLPFTAVVGIGLETNATTPQAVKLDKKAVDVFAGGAASFALVTSSQQKPRPSMARDDIA